MAVFTAAEDKLTELDTRVATLETAAAVAAWPTRTS